MSQDALAELCGVSQSYLSKLLGLVDRIYDPVLKAWEGSHAGDRHLTHHHMRALGVKLSKQKNFTVEAQMAEYERMLEEEQQAEATFDAIRKGPRHHE